MRNMNAPTLTTPLLENLDAEALRRLILGSLRPDSASFKAARAPHGAKHTPSDFDLNPEALAELGGHIGQRPAAVLVPIVARAELSLLLTQRTPHLSAHGGQISFPGGKIDDTDTDATATALREAEEEIGLSRTYVETLGHLDDYHTGTGFRITPVVALVQPEYPLRINEEEVTDVFEVPLSFVIDGANWRTDNRTIGGRERRFYAIPFGDRYIWGATAGILMNMRRRLFGS